MKSFVLQLVVLFGMGASLLAQEWINYRLDSLEVLYPPSVTALPQIAGYITSSRSLTEFFFGKPFRKKFIIRIHGTRHSFDKQLAEDWKVPDFKSECWMVASGSASGMDILSPSTWNTTACEHASGDTIAARRVIHHELVHVYHGQWNKSPDFSAISGLDWFVEGLATYASGQLDSSRRLQVFDLIRDNQVPGNLDLFWTGKTRYGLSGAMVEYIDKRYGRKLIMDLLPFSTKQDVLDKLEISEDYLIKNFTISWPCLSGNPAKQSP